MKISWRPFFRRMARVCLVSTATAWSSAVGYAQIAADNASDPVYADGWQGTTTNNTTGVQETTGDNGGFGFEPWNFDTDWIFNPDPLDGIQSVDNGLKSGGGNPDSSPFNQVGRAWRMALPLAQDGNNGLPRAGRGFPALQVGQTFSVVFDNPTDQRFFKGYFIRFNSRHGAGGGGNISYEYAGYSHAASAADLNGDGHNVPLSGVDPSPKLVLQRFEYTDGGQWGVVNQADADPASEFHHIPLYDADTAKGARLDFKLTGPDAYQLTLASTNVGSPDFVTYMETGTLLTPGAPIDWIEFTFFNTESDPGFETDLYIRSLTITGPASTGDFNQDHRVDGADFLIWQRGFGKTSGATLAQGDGNQDGAVNAADFAAWKGQFGQAVASPASTGVPEPGTSALLVMAAAGLARRKNPNGSME